MKLFISLVVLVSASMSYAGKSVYLKTHDCVLKGDAGLNLLGDLIVETYMPFTFPVPSKIEKPLQVSYYESEFPAFKLLGEFRVNEEQTEAVGELSIGGGLKEARFLIPSEAVLKKPEFEITVNLQKSKGKVAQLKGLCKATINPN